MCALTSSHNYVHGIAAGDQCKLPSTAKGHVVILPQSEEYDKPTTSSQKQSHLCLQLIVDRLLKQLISNRVKAQQTTTTPKSYALNKREKNAVCCMAGYVAESAEMLQEVKEQACPTQARSFHSSVEIHEGRTTTIITQQHRRVHSSVV